MLHCIKLHIFPNISEKNSFVMMHRKLIDSPLKVFSRMHFEARVKKYCYDVEEISDEKVKQLIQVVMFKIGKHFASHQWKEIIVSAQLVTKYKKDVDALFLSLESFGYIKDKDFM